MLLIARIIGAVLPAYLLFLLAHAVVKRAKVAAPYYAAHAIALGLATFIGGLGMADGGDPKWGFSFGLYLPAQLIVFGLTGRRRAAAPPIFTRPTARVANRIGVVLACVLSALIAFAMLSDGLQNSTLEDLTSTLLVIEVPGLIAWGVPVLFEFAVYWIRDGMQSPSAVAATTVPAESGPQDA